MKYNSKSVIIGLTLLFSAHYCAAQMPQKKTHIKATYDSSYYNSFIMDIVARYYFSQKFTTAYINGIEKGEKLKYIPNTTLNMGVGATYKPLTINLGYGLGFLNRDKEKGKTKYLDLQSHLYLRKWVFDMFGQFYKGYYLRPKGYASSIPDQYYIRPDMHVSLIGFSVYKVFNYKKFSYRAAMVQNEWQKKSAGSFLAGMEVYYGAHSADSAFVPTMLNNKFDQKGIKRIRFFELGPGVGYTYTLVVAKHFFATASLTLNPKFSLSSELSDNKSKTHVSIVPGYFARGAIGYNSEHWNANLSFVGNKVLTKGSHTTDHYSYNTSNVRLTFAKHFIPGPKLRHKLNEFDKHFQKNVPIPIDVMKPERPE